MVCLKRTMTTAALVVCCLLSSADVSAGGTYRFKTKNYLIETTVSPEFTLEIGELMEILNAGYSKVFTGRATAKGASRVTVYKDRSEYMSNGGLPNSGGFFSPMTCEIRTYVSPALRETLAHEGFHQFFNKFIGPGAEAQWINEGLAQLFQYSLIDGTDIKYGLVSKQDMKAIQEILASSDQLSMKELLTLDNRTWNENMEASINKARCQYAQARFFVHFLRLAYDEKYVKYLGRYIKAVQAGKSGAAAVSMGFGPKYNEIAEAFPKWVKEDLKPCAPDSCTANLFHLAQLYYQFHKAGIEFDGLDDLKEKVKSNKDLKWNVIPITLDTDGLYGPENMDQVEKWFVCTKSGKGYDLLEDPEAPEEGLPMIVCYEHHKKLAVCACFKKQEFGGKSMIFPDVRNRQTKDLKKISKKSKKK